MAIEDLRVIGNVLYEQRSDGLLYPVRQVAGQTPAQSQPQASQGLLSGIPELGRMVDKLGLLNRTFNPIEGIGQSMDASQRMFAPDTSTMDRLTALGDMLSGVAGVTAPIGAAVRAGTPAAVALMEGLLGGSPTVTAARDTARAAGRGFVERMNQPGPVPTMYSNPVLGLFGNAGVGIEDILRAKYPDVKLSISGTAERGYTLNRIDVPKTKRNSGVGTAIMGDLVNLADQQGAVLKLSPSGDFGGSIPRLKDFYARFGFIQNKGKNSDYAISESMYRPPASVSNLPAPRNEAEAIAKSILELRATGNVDAVTNDMMNAADPQYMYNYTPLPMDQASRMARASDIGFDIGKTRYTGTEADIRDVNTNLGTGERYRTGLFTSTNPDVADSYVSTEGGMIYPMVMRRNQGGVTIDAQGANWNRIAPNSPANIPSEGLMAEFPELALEKVNTAYDVAPNLFDDLFGKGASTNALARQKRFEGDSNITFENVVDRGAYQKKYLGETDEMAKARQMSASMPSDVRVDFYGNQVRSPFARFDPMFAHLGNLSAGVAISPLAYGLLSNQYERKNRQ